MTALKLPPIALGAWAWGNDDTFGDVHTAEDLRPVFEAGMDAGLNLWDTSYVYGMGISEKTLATFLKGLPRDSYILSDKLTPQAMDSTSPTPVKDMIEMQRELLGVDRFDIYWVHNAAEAPRWTRLLAEYFDGREDAPIIGLSNHTLAEIEEAEAILAEHGLRVGAIQNHYSLIKRDSESGGILAWCHDNRVPFFSYMVLEQGALTGRYSSACPMPEGSGRAKAYNPVMDRLDVLNAELAKVAQAHGVPVAQVPIAWAIAKGTLPLIGVTKASQVDDAAAAARLELSGAEIASLEAVAESIGVDILRIWEKKMD